MATGSYWTCGVKNSGTMWCWGQAGYLFSSEHAVNPHPIQIGASRRWTAVEAGDNHACGLRTDGTAWCWGAGPEMLGAGHDVNDPQTPQQVGKASDWVELDGGFAHACGLRTGGALYCWGLNVQGSLGTGSASGRWRPARVPGS